MTEEISNYKRKNRWANDSIASKSIIIIGLIILLQLPTVLIRNIVDERNDLHQEAIKEVSNKWANAQQIAGPILTIPYYTKRVVDEKLEVKRHYFHLMPDELKIDGAIETSSLRRGIYEVVVYGSDLSFNGEFTWSDKILEVDFLDFIDYENAFLTIGVSDLRGLKDEVLPVWNGKALKIESGSQISTMITSGITSQVGDVRALQEGPISFSFEMDLQGSSDLTFVPLAKVTDVHLESPWTSPSFTGNFLPVDREWSEDGFMAEWKVYELNRNIPHETTGNISKKKMEKASFGVELMLPLDDYQKTERSIKYGIMTIALTFLVFFLVEVLNKRRIHPFQYGLVGLALCLFYVLLLSISEQTNFNIAYAISTFGIVTMIALYSLSVFKMKKTSGILVLVMSSVYTFLFVILQMADYALLMGSIGLTIILALTMYLTRNIDWYSEKEEA